MPKPLYDTKIMPIFALSNSKCGTMAAITLRFFRAKLKSYVAAKRVGTAEPGNPQINGLHRVGYRITTPRHSHFEA